MILCCIYLSTDFFFLLVFSKSLLFFDLPSFIVMVNNGDTFDCTFSSAPRLVEGVMRLSLCCNHKLILEHNSRTFQFGSFIQLDIDSSLLFHVWSLSDKRAAPSFLLSARPFPQDMCDRQKYRLFAVLLTILKLMTSCILSLISNNTAALASLVKTQYFWVSSQKQKASTQFLALVSIWHGKFFHLRSANTSIHNTTTQAPQGITHHSLRQTEPFHNTKHSDIWRLLRHTAITFSYITKVDIG